MNQDIDFEIIWKKIHGRISEEEEILLDQWLKDESSHQKFFANALDFYSKGTRFNLSPSELKKTLKNIHRKTGVRKPLSNSRIIAVTSIAASILFLIYFQFYRIAEPAKVHLAKTAQSIVPGSHKAILVMADGSVHDLTSGNSSIIATDGTEIKNTGTKLEYIGTGINPSELRYNTLKIPRGGEYFLVLSDSTKVWLNSETTLRYPVQFAANIRNVELTGEAYFEVARNEKVPFVVTSGNQKVKVLGTHFNISSYAENEAIFTTLIEGRVEVSLENNPESKLILNPSEQSTTSKSGNLIQKRTVDASLFVAWKDGRFVFQDQKLEDIMNTLAKWYDVQVIFDQEKLKQVRFTGNLERYADISEILGKIERTNEVKFAVNKNVITIK